MSFIISKYEVDRTEKETQKFKYIGDIPFPSNGDMIYYRDEGVETKDSSYQYHVFPIDTCGRRVSSPIVPLWLIDTSLGQTILCEVEINTEYKSVLSEEYTNTINFNEYIDWLGDVSHYNLYRSTNREPFVLIPIHTFYPGDTLMYIDVVSEFVDGNGRFCYYIETVKAGFKSFWIY